MKISSLFCLIYVIPIVMLSPLSLDLETNSKGIVTNICLGSNKQCFDTKISLNSVITWVPHENNSMRRVTKFDEDSTKTCETVERRVTFFSEDKSTLEGKILKDTLTLSSTKINDFIFLASTDSENYPKLEGMLSLGPPITGDDERYSLLSQLKQQNIINHQVIAVQYNAKKEQGKIDIGQIPSEIMDDYKIYGTCDLQLTSPQLKDDQLPFDRYWECKAKGITIGSEIDSDNIIEGTSNIRFDYGINKSIIPIPVLLKLEKEYFKKQIESGNCNFGVKNELYTYTCYDFDFELPEITIVYDSWGMVFRLKSLMIYDEDEKEYEFALHGKYNENNYILGTDLLDKYIMVFDLSNNNIGFYPSSGNAITAKAPGTRPTQPNDYSKGGIPEPPVRPKEEEPLIKPDKEEQDIFINDSGDKSEEPFTPPFYDPSDGSNIGKVIPIETETSFIAKFFKCIGVLFLVIACLFVGWLGFRYMRRKKYTNPKLYYKVSDELFNEGTPLE